MSPDLLPFALIRAHGAQGLAGHLVITPRHAAFIPASTERVIDCSHALAPSREPFVREALLEFARWEQPLSLAPEDEPYAIARMVAPDTQGAELVAVNMAPASIGVLTNTLVAFRAADMVHGWPQVVDAVRALADAAATDGPLRAVTYRDLNDAPRHTLMTTRGMPVVTMGVWPSSRSVRCWVWHSAARWHECDYTIADDGPWVRRSRTETAPMPLYSAAEIARDILFPCRRVASTGATRHRRPVPDTVGVDRLHQAVASWR